MKTNNREKQLLMLCLFSYLLIAILMIGGYFYFLPVDLPPDAWTGEVIKVCIFLFLLFLPFGFLYLITIMWYEKQEMDKIKKFQRYYQEEKEKDNNYFPPTQQV